MHPIIYLALIPSFVFVLLALRATAIRNRNPRRSSDSQWAADAQAMHYMKTGRNHVTISDMYGSK